jgi:hypothetical protein
MGETQLPGVFIGSEAASELAPTIQRAADLIRSVPEPPATFGAQAMTAAGSLRARDDLARQGFRDAEEAIRADLDRLARMTPSLINGLVATDDDSARDLATLRPPGGAP